jgi:hypothetical protein
MISEELRTAIGEEILLFKYSSAAIRELDSTTKRHLESTLDSIFRLMEWYQEK